MSYRKVEMYSLFCDSCGKMYVDGNDFCAWGDSDMDDHEESEWSDLDDKHYCPRCHTIDQNGEVLVNAKPDGNE